MDDGRLGKDGASERESDRKLSRAIRRRTRLMRTMMIEIEGADGPNNQPAVKAATLLL